jgi:tetratricopeptide (TPR) repeat protein
MDTETTGLAGGTGTLAFMVGLGFYHHGDFHLFQGFLRDPSDERAMLEVMSERLTGIDTVVTYNGKSFDVPLLHSRFVMNGLTKAFVGMRHIDLLHVARKLWKHRLSSRTLGVVENEILGFFRSAEEVPGWMAPELYFQYQKTGDASGIVPMFYHNAMDILTLGVLLRVVAELINEPDSFNSPGVDIVSIARMYTDLRDFDQAISLYEKGIQRELPIQIYLDAALRFADLFKRQHLFEKSVPLWEKAVSFGSEEACEELAKYYEHQKKDYENAMKWVNAGFECLKRQGVDRYYRRRQEEAFQHRLERLLEKWQKSNTID